MSERVSRDEMIMLIAGVVALRSTCKRGKVGCVITRDNRIISTGYVGAPAGLPHCIEGECEIGPDGGCIATSHAEAGAIAFAARKGIATEGSTLYTTLSPCLSCAKDIINAGIKRVVYLREYRDLSGLTLLMRAGVSVLRLDKELSLLIEILKEGITQ